MKRRKFILCLFGAAAVGGIGWGLKKGRNVSGAIFKQPRDLVKISRTRQALGTKVAITAFHQDARSVDAALNSAFAAIEQVEELMSLYRLESQITQLNHNQTLRDPHPDLVYVLETAQRLSEKSKGAFDVTIQPVWRLFFEAAQKGVSPSQAELALALEKVDWRSLKVESKAVRLANPETAITLNGIAQGFAADKASEALKAYGVRSALIDTGEIGSIGHPAEREGWTIGIKHPRKEDAFLGLAKLDERCLATSGDYETYFSDDFRHNHLLDARTGRSPRDLSSVSVVATTAMEADALSTAAFTMGLTEGKKLIEKESNADALFVTKSGQLFATPNFPMPA